MTQNSFITATCRDVSSMIAAAFPGLTIYFVPYKEGFESNAFEKQRDQIFRHFGADDIFQAFSVAPKPFAPNKRHILGPFRSGGISFPLFEQKPKIVACIFVPAHTFRHQNHVIFHLLSAAYPVILDIHMETALCAALEDLTQEELAHLNMLSDWFGALGGQLLTKNPFIKDLTTLRCERVFLAGINSLPELFPAPLAYDAATLIYEELHPNIVSDDSLRAALEMTKEIDSIIPAHFIGKWIAFVERAQKLAWGGAESADILGMALHTCEDLDIRAIAGIVADTLHITPRLATYTETYNPFAEDEVNERHHKNAALALLKQIIWRIRRSQPFDFKDSFLSQNIAFIKSHPLGWCAPSIKALTDEILSIKGQFSLAAPDNKKETNLTLLHNIFIDRLEQIRWRELAQIFELIHAQKRQGFCFTGNSLITLLRSSDAPHLDMLERVFAPYADRVLHDFSQTGEDLNSTSIELEDAL